MMSKAELARKAGLSTLTIDRVEAGRPCRLDTKRKILLALGLKVSDKDRLFGPAASMPARAAAETGYGPSDDHVARTIAPATSAASNPAEGEGTR
jgi:hypothetical protein